MKKFNLIKSLTRVMNNIPALQGKVRMGLLCLSLAVFGVNEVWGACNYTLSNESKNQQETKDGEKTFYSCSVSNEYGISNISFTFKLSSAAVYTARTDASCNIQYTTDGNTWIPFKTFQSKDKLYISGGEKTYNPSYTVTPSDGIFNATGIRVLTVSNDRKITYKATACTITMASTLTPEASVTIADTKIDASNFNSFDVTYSNMEGQTMTVISDQSCFIPSTNIGLECSGKETITVEYKPTCDNHATSATITLKAGSITKTVTANASCALNDGEVTWNATDEQKKMKVGVDLDISGFATAKYSDQGTISYSSSDPNTIAVNGTTLTAKKSGTADITATIPEGCKYKEANATTTFTVLSKATPVFTPSWDNHSSTKALKVGDKVTLTVENVSDGLTEQLFEASATKDSGNDILSFSRKGNLITIEALNAGTSTATFKQTETTDIFGQTQSYKFSVTKIDNTLSVDAASHTMYVGDNWEDKVTTNSDATINVSSTDATLAYYDLGSQKIVAQNTNNQSFTSTDVTITIKQEETYKYTEASKTIKVTVNKHVPTFTWSNTALYHNQTYNDFFTTTGTNALTVKSSDDDVAYLVDGANAQKLNLKTLTKAASTTLTITQAENYYWAEHTEQKTITPGYQSNHVSLTITNANHSTFENGLSSDCQWDGSSYKMCDGGWSSQTDYVILHFTGIPDTLTFDKSNEKSLGQLPGTSDFKVYESSNGTSWGDAIWTRGNREESYSASVQLSPTTQYIKLEYYGTVYAHWKNITVTELKTFSTDKSEIDFGSNKKDIACASQTFTFNYANVGHKVVLETSDPHFSVSPTSITNIGGEQYGTQTIIVSYRTDEVHSATNAKLTIKDELGNSKEVTLKGSTTKKAQTLKWEKPYDVEEPAIPIGKTITGVATASSNLGVIYESSDETIIEIVDDGKAFKAIKEGSATITAKQLGTDDWEAANSISKVFKTTNKIIQVISWNQNFTRLLTTYGSQELTAIVNLENAETGEQTHSKERSDMITYSSQNTSVVSVNGSTLTIVGKGETTLTATVPGDDLYESATVTIPVKVREPSAGCEDVLLGNNFGPDEYEFFHYSATEDMEKVVKIDRTTSAIPGELSFQHKGKKWASIFFDGSIDVYESTDNQSSWKKLGSVTPLEGTYSTQTYILSRNATHIKFFRGKSATGYHYIKNVEISPAQFIESNAANKTIDFGKITVNSVEERTVTLSYANVKDVLTITKSSNNLTLSCGDIIDLDCGETGTNTFTITFIPTVVGDFSDDIQFLDKNSNKNYTLHVSANVVKSSQHITWEPTQTEYRTIDQIELNATASSNNPVQYYVKEGKDIADFVNGVLIIKKDGQITIRAHEPGDALWAPAVDVDKTFTIRKTNLHFDPLPTAATITYPQALSESSLTDGVVKDEDGNVVAGTIAWTNPTTQLNAGENQTQGITFSPTNNVAWYNSLTSTVTVTVQKAQPDALAHAGDIIYGVAVQTSALTNEGTTEGTWSWTDEKKDQVLNVGTYEGLQVHFTPTDKTNYNEIDGTVSLTVTKAQPIITWTGATTFEWGEIDNYFVADNEGTVVMSSQDESVATIQDNKIIPVKAGTVTIQGDMAESDNYQSATLAQTITINVPSENKFTNAAGDNNWNNPTNWSAGLVPEKMDEANIVVSGELNIEEKVVVGSLTIEDGGSVNVLQGGDLTIQSASGEADAFGDLYVKNGGDVTLNGTLNVHDFVIESSIGTADGSSKSGQITNAQMLNFNDGDAYIDIHLDPSGTADDSQWYGFTVPFEVDIATGIYRQENDGSFKQLKDKTNFDIMQYNPAKRLSTGKGWEYYHGVLNPGEFYYLAIDGNNNVYRFRKKTGVGFTNEAQIDLHVNGDITNPNANWNPVGNPCLRYTTTDYDGFVQVYKNGQSAYLTVDASDVTYVVGCPFFVQAQEEGSLLLETSGATEGHFYAPRRMAVDKTKNQIQLLNQGKVEDQIFIMASDDATSDYETGSDLLKAGVSKLCGQMWLNAYGQQLSVQDAPLQDETALYNLSLYAPKAGEYMLHVGSQTNYSEIYLTLNGIIIWNLSQSDYPISLFKGTTNEYGLVFQRTQPNTPTDLVSPNKDNRVNKFIHHEQMYILHNGQLYNATGAMVK